MAGYKGIEGFTKEWAEDIKKQCDDTKKMVGKTYRVYSDDEDVFEFDPYKAKVVKWTDAGLKLKMEGNDKEIFISFEDYPYFGFEQV